MFHLIKTKIVHCSHVLPDQDEIPVENLTNTICTKLQIICSCSFAANTISKFPDNHEEFYRGPHIQYLHQRTKTNPLDVHLLIILCVTFQVFKIKNCTCRPCVLARKKWTYQRGDQQLKIEVRKYND